MSRQRLVTHVDSRPRRWDFALVLCISSMGLLASLACWAVDSQITQVKDSAQGAVQFNTSLSVNHPFTRSQWGLSDAEWSRYQNLMQGIRGSLSPSTLSPLEVLGIHAETDAERREYASKLAKIMQDDTKRVLAFAKIYAEESQKLNPSVLIDKAGLGLPDKVQPQPPLSSDRFLLFIRIKDCQRCEQDLSNLMTVTQQSHSQLDIYIVDAPTDQTIRDWAKTKALDPDRLKRKTLTLNHNRGQLAKLIGLTATVPQTVMIRQGQQQVVSPSDWLNK